MTKIPKKGFPPGSNSAFIRKIGRTIRGCDLGILRAIESLLVRNCPDEEIQMPLLAVGGPPRSGHTLTYQVITQGLQVFVVNNLHCLFYRTPLIGYLLSKILCRPYVSDYNSTGGYIPGLNGPHEGAWIWGYWCDMGLKERYPQQDPDRMREFCRLMNKLYALDGRPYCDSWVGHALYFEHLQNLFRHCIIVCARRDLLSTALSIVHFTRNQGSEYRLSWSAQPQECQDPSVLSRLSTYERIAWQVYFINRRMDEQIATGRYAAFNSLYSDLCENPRGFISRLTAFAQTQGVVLASRTDTELPVRFTATKAHRDQSEHTKKLASAFDALLDQYGPVGVPLEQA
jgi:hypothetical protein